MSGKPMMNFLRVLLTLASLIAVVTSPAFSPSIVLALLLMALSGVIAIFGQLKTAIVNLAICSVAIILGPWNITTIDSITSLLLFLVPMAVGYGGLLIGVSKVSQ